jgi:uncharacterized protein (TIGR02453 family)
MSARQTTFSGWGKEFRDFYTGLERDNSRNYFEANNLRYQRAVRGPAIALLSSLEPEFGPGRIFRSNRDIRFTADKRPFHTNIALEFAGSGTHYYLSASAHELVASVGVFQPPAGWTQRFRDAVAGPPGEVLSTIVADLESQGFDIGGGGRNKVPRGYPSDHPRARLLKHRSLTAARRWPPAEWLGSPRARDLVVECWRQCDGMAGWLRSHAPIGGRHVA